MGFVLLYSFERTDFVHLYISGDDTWMVPPVPIPNTVVKHPEAESTCLVTGREDRKLPVDTKSTRFVECFFHIRIFGGRFADFLKNIFRASRYFSFCVESM